MRAEALRGSLGLGSGKVVGAHEESDHLVSGCGSSPPGRPWVRPQERGEAMTDPTREELEQDAAPFIEDFFKPRIEEA